MLTIRLRAVTAVLITSALGLCACSGPSAPKQPFAGVPDLAASVAERAEASEGIRFKVEATYGGQTEGEGEGVIFVKAGNISVRSKTQYDGPDRIGEIVDTGEKVFLRTYPGERMVPRDGVAPWTETTLSAAEPCESFDWWILLGLRAAYESQVLAESPSRIIDSKEMAGLFEYSVAVSGLEVLESVTGAPQGNSKCFLSQLTFTVDESGKLRSMRANLSIEGQAAEVSWEYLDWDVEGQIDVPTS